MRGEFARAGGEGFEGVRGGGEGEEWVVRGDGWVCEGWGVGVWVRMGL